MTPKSTPTARLVLRATAAAPVAIALALLATGCSRQPEAPEDAAARGKALVRAMSDRLVRETAFTVATRDTRTRQGQAQPLATEREFTVRRPDRIAFTAKGDHLDLRGWYADGKVTLISPASKVWARVRGDATIDGTLDRLAERFEMQMPMADFLYSVPYDALLVDGMTGGYVGSETVDQTACAHVSFADDTVEWHLWLPESGDPLPKKFRITAKKMPGVPTSEVLFVKWTLGAAADTTFVPKVPEGFERIAMAARDVGPAVEPASAQELRKP